MEHIHPSYGNFHIHIDACISMEHIHPAYGDIVPLEMLLTPWIKLEPKNKILPKTLNPKP